MTNSPSNLSRGNGRPERPALPAPAQGGYAEYCRRMAAFQAERKPVLTVPYDWRTRRSFR